MNKFFISIVITLLLSICISGVYAESTVILYTNDVHCGYTEADFDFGTESYFNCDKAILSSIAVSIDLSELESFG